MQDVAVETRKRHDMPQPHDKARSPGVPLSVDKKNTKTESYPLPCFAIHVLPRVTAVTISL